MILADTRLDDAIDASLARVRARADRFGGSFAALGDAIGRAATGGKRLRPTLVVASFTAFGGDPREQEPVYLVGAAFELLHTAFVVHDDVIDHDTERRGVPNISGEFRMHARVRGADAEGQSSLGDAAAILAGDLLLHEASRVIALADVAPAIRDRLFTLLDDAVYASAAGELADVEHSVAAEFAQARAILEASFNKTAVYSFSAPMQAGALLAGAGEHEFDAVGRAGGKLGLAFQLVDDLIGAFGSTDQAGRGEGGDLREAKRTPLIALARDTGAWPRVSATLALARTGPVAIRAAQEALEDSGARDQLRMLIAETLEDARAAAALLPPAASGVIDDLAARIEDRVP